MIALWLNLAMALHWLGRRSLRQPDWRLWLAGQAAVTLLWLPWLSSWFVNVISANSALRDGPQAGLTLLRHMWGALWLAPWDLVLQTPLTDVAVILALATLLLLPWRLPGTRRLALHVVLLASLLTLGLGIIGNNMHGRYLVVLVPLHCVLLGSSVAGQASRGRGTLLVLLSAAVLLLNLQLAADPALQHDDARGMVRYYSETLSDADSVLAWSYAERYELGYYWRRFGTPAQLITLPEGAGMDVGGGPVAETGQGGVEPVVHPARRLPRHGSLFAGAWQHGPARRPFGIRHAQSALRSGARIPSPASNPGAADFCGQCRTGPS